MLADDPLLDEDDIDDEDGDEEEEEEEGVGGMMDVNALSVDTTFDQLEEAEEFYSREGSESSARAANVEQVRIQFILLRTKFFATFATLSRIRCHQYTFALHTCEF